MAPKIPAMRHFLHEFVYGGIDGSITTFAVVAGAVGAEFDVGIILVLGFANLLADGFSMSVGAYLSAKSVGAMPGPRQPIYIGVATFLSFFVAGLLPLLVYLWDFWIPIPGDTFVLASLVTGLTFAGIGWLKGYVNRTSLLRSITETVLLGAVAAAIAYFVGDWLATIIPS